MVEFDARLLQSAREMLNARSTPALALAAMLLIPAIAAAECPIGDQLTGTFDPIDADSGDLLMTAGPVEIRLEGIAAPEWDDPGGDEATAAMVELVRGETLLCEIRDEDRYGKVLAVLVAALTAKGTCAPQGSVSN